MIVRLEVEVERDSGPFRSKQDVGQELAEVLDGEQVDVEGSEYTVQTVNVLD